MKGGQPQPFAAVHLGLGQDIVDFAWNPGLDFAGLFAVCLSDGGMHLLELKELSVAQVASLPPAATATCREFLCSLFFCFFCTLKFRNRMRPHFYFCLFRH